MAFASLAGLFFLWGKCLALSSFSSADLNFKMMLEEKGGREDRQIYLGCPLQSDIGVDRGGKIGDRRPKIKTRVGGSQRCRGENSNKSFSSHLSSLNICLRPGGH